MSQFVHLHLHTDYSMLDGACDVEQLVHRARPIDDPDMLEVVEDVTDWYGPMWLAKP